MIRLASPDELSLVLSIRHRVFVQEQGVSIEEEVDGLDPGCIHLLAVVGGEGVGTARLRALSLTVAKAERVAVLSAFRGRGLGQALMGALEEEARRQGHAEVRLGAQLPVLGFYEALGYIARGPVFLDAGIPHREMRKPL